MSAKTPNIILLGNLLQSVNECAMSPDGKVWYPARPTGFWSWSYRLKAAWLVWTGRADALIWPAGQ